MASRIAQLAQTAEGETAAQRLVSMLINGIDPDYVEPGVKCEPLPSSYMPWRDWLGRYYPHAAYFEPAPHHVDFWNWLETITPGICPRPRIEIWARGGGKSTSVELGVARIGARLARRFCLYVCGTQEQADKHVQDISAHFERLNVARAVNKFGNPKGWRRNQLRVANGFNVQGLGLDVSVRGIKFDEFRPDFIVFDDIDSESDTLRTIDQKLSLIKNAILPAGSTDCAVLGVQNVIHEDSIFARLLDGRADFLLDREVIGPIPAVLGMKTELYRNEEGQGLHRIIEGTPTWAGQSIEICEQQMNRYSYRSFLTERQHEVKNADGFVFNTSQIPSIAPENVPELIDIVQCWDLAATEGDGDHTAGPPMGKAANGTYYVFGMVRGQWSAERVNAAIDISSRAYKELWPNLRIFTAQDPGQAGKAQANQMRKEHEEIGLKTALVGRKGKVTRGRKFIDECNKGNIYLVQMDIPAALMETKDPRVGRKPLIENLTWQDWHMRLKDELRRFREDTPNQMDDQFDALTDCYNNLVQRRKGRIAS